jgi:beta-glucosidase/6-phospho-beta-glucosidase/beta-galactosidase
LTPPAYFQSLIQLPHPYRDIPLANPQQSDPYWQSLLGWENEQTVNEFIEYVSKIVAALKDQVDYWLTINEPVTSTIGLGYMLGVWSPGFVLDGNRAEKVLHNLIEAHVRAYNIISAIDNVDSDGDGIPAKIGFAHCQEL